MKDGGRIPASRRWRRTPALSGKPGRDPHRISVWLAALTSPRVACSNAIEKRAREQHFAGDRWSPPGVTRAGNAVSSYERRLSRLSCSRVERLERLAFSGAEAGKPLASRPQHRWLILTCNDRRRSEVSSLSEREASITSTCCHRFVCETDDIPTLSGRLRVVFRPRGLSQLPRNI